MVAKQLTYSDTASSTQSDLFSYDVETGWKDWIFEESRRRLDVYQPRTKGLYIKLLNESKVMRGLSSGKYASLFRASGDV